MWSVVSTLAWMIHNCLYVSSSGGRRTFLRIALPSIVPQFYNVGMLALTKNGDFAQRSLGIRFGAKYIRNPFDRISVEQLHPLLLLMRSGVLSKVDSSVGSLPELLYDDILRIDRTRSIRHILKTITDQLCIRTVGYMDVQTSKIVSCLVDRRKIWKRDHVICTCSGDHLPCLSRHASILLYRTPTCSQSGWSQFMYSELLKQTEHYGQQLVPFPNVMNDL